MGGERTYTGEVGGLRDLVKRPKAGVWGRVGGGSGEWMGMRVKVGRGKVC